VNKTTPKALGFWMCLALVVGNMIGSGVFMLPASLAPYGWNGVFGWLVTIAGALCLAFVFARLAAAFPKAGGPYAYTREAFGPAVGFLVAWSYWISLWVGNAAIATGGVSYLSVFLPVLKDTPGLSAIVTCAIIWGLTAVNCRGVRVAGHVQLVTTVLKLLPLIAVVILAVVVLGREGLSAAPPFRASDISASGITAAATLTLWAFLGLESATVPAGKVDDPQRTIPRATMIGTIVTGLVYLFACSAVALLLPPEQAAHSNAPFADFVARAWGGDAGLLIAAFAAISCFGALNGWILLQGEMPHAMARDGVFPAWLGETSKWGTPVRAHVTSSALLTIVMLMNYSKSMTDLFTFVVLLATSASLVAYLVCSLAALKLQKEKRLESSAAPALIAILAVAYSLWTIYGAGPEATGWGFVLLVAGVPVYWLMRRRQRAAR
jgi:APA family basic amino acid/polyamine antiporter